MSKSKVKNSPGLRLAIIAGLTLVLLIPAIMIQVLVNERKIRRDSAVTEVSDKWGNRQVITGPILSIPFRDYITDNKGNQIATTKYAHLLPDELTIAGIVKPETRYRGIYEIVVYNSRLKLDANFTLPDLNDLKIAAPDIMWQDAIVALGISDLKGIKEFINIKWNHNELKANPGIETNDILAAGISIRTGLEPSTPKLEFFTELNLNGSSELLFTPVGKETRVSISSDWSNPSFTGAFLPETRDVSSRGFSAEWKILHLNRNYPQQWLGTQFQVDASSSGIKLLVPVDEYQKTMRTVKYAIMFISLTFLSFFMIELLSKKAIHPIQYLLIGFALLIFYTLLLSFSEHMLFKYAYLLASVSILSLITAYSWSILAQKLQTLVIAGILILLYSYLYIILQLQDYALLMGSLGLFIILAIVMYLTRKIDWFLAMKVKSD